MNKSKWTFEKLQEEALKYKTRTEFQKSCKAAYLSAYRKGILDKICNHMEILWEKKWTFEKLQEEALKYNNKTEFKKNSNAYVYAHRKGILDEICAHMKPKLIYWTNEMLHKEALKYKSRAELYQKNPGVHSTSLKRDILNDICKHMKRSKVSSLPQENVLNFVKQFYSDAIQNTKQLITPLELDIYIPSIKVAIEYCGLHWHKEKELYKKENETEEEFTSRKKKQKEKHHTKMINCNKLGIRLITIFEDEWLTRQEQVKGFLLSVLHKNTINLFARKLKLREVLKSEATNFLENTHIQGSTPFSIAFGLYNDQELVGIITGNIHHRQGFKDIFVLNRLAFKNNTNIVGGASRLLKALLNYAIQNGYSKLISWSDNRWSEGNVYKKLGFTLTEELPIDYSYVKRNKRISKQSCQKKHLLKQGATGKTEKEMAKSLNLYRIWDCGKKRWEIVL